MSGPPTRRKTPDRGQGEHRVEGTTSDTREIGADPTATDHPTGTAQAAANAAEEPAG